MCDRDSLTRYIADVEYLAGMWAFQATLSRSSRRAIDKAKAETFALVAETLRARVLEKLT